MTSKTDIPDIPYKRSTQTRSEGTSQGGRYDPSCEIKLRLSDLVDICRRQDLDPVRVAAVALGMAGSVFVAIPATSWRAAGFVSWVAANSLWVVHGRRAGDRYIIVLFSFYLVTAIIGLWGVI